MYTPKHFLPYDDIQTKNLISENSFATVLSFPENEGPCINHLPIIFSSDENEQNVLIGHMARRNPQWRHFQKNPNGAVIIHGAHTYITPNWYRSGRDVPTWNYAVAHLYGKFELVESFQGQIAILKQLTEFFEKSSKNPWLFDLPDDLLDPAALMSAIVSFKFYTEKIDAKFKLSQNRSEEDQQGILVGLCERTDDMSSGVLAMMLKEKKC